MILSVDKDVEMELAYIADGSLNWHDQFGKLFISIL